MHTAITRLFGIEHPLLCPGMSYIATPELVAADNARVALEEQAPVINYSLGKGDWIAEAAHRYGGKVLATVVTEKHAVSAQKCGADALLVTGHEAAAHGGLIAALALGADAVAMGTRLAMTRESPVHANTKDMVLQRGVADTLYSKNFDGLWCRMMDTPAARRASRKPLGLMPAAFRASAVARRMGMPVLKVAIGGMLKQPQALRQLALFGAATESIRLAIQDGDHEKGVQLIGQAQGLIDDIPSVAELFERLMHEAEQCRTRLTAYR